MKGPEHYREAAAKVARILRMVADDDRLLWEVARKAIEDELIDWRDEGRFVLRNNGFTVKYKDGSPSDIIRFGPEVGIRIALRALADHYEAEANR